MNIKVVTDSTADLPVRIAEELGITVIPAYVHIGNEVYRDRLEINEDQLYQRLLAGTVHPRTEPPSPQDFARVYEELLREADGVLSVHISGKLSATVNSALRGKELLPHKYPIEVVDSQSVTMGLGFLAMSAAALARSGGHPAEIAGEVKRQIGSIRLFGLLDTLDYLARGGRIGRAKAWLGSMLSVKPMLTMRDGEIEPVGRARSRAAGIKELYSFIENTPDVRELAIIYSTDLAEAQELGGRARAILDGQKVIMARLGPVLGVHAGPGIVFVALRVG